VPKRIAACGHRRCRFVAGGSLPGLTDAYAYASDDNGDDCRGDDSIRIRDSCFGWSGRDASSSMGGYGHGDGYGYGDGNGGYDAR